MNRRSSLTPRDLTAPTTKAVCLRVTLIHCYYGNFTSGGPAGVGQALPAAQCEPASLWSWSWISLPPWRFGASNHNSSFEVSHIMLLRGSQESQERRLTLAGAVVVACAIATGLRRHVTSIRKPNN